MLGTLRRALAVREIPTGREYLTADVAGEVFKEKNNVLKIKNIKILYNLTIEKELFDEKKRSNRSCNRSSCFSMSSTSLYRKFY